MLCAVLPTNTTSLSSRYDLAAHTYTLSHTPSFALFVLMTRIELVECAGAAAATAVDRSFRVSEPVHGNRDTHSLTHTPRASEKVRTRPVVDGSMCACEYV